MRVYGLFTPSAIAQAIELSKSLPIPTDPRIVKKIGYSPRSGQVNVTSEVSMGVAWVLQKLAVSRGVTKSRIILEILTYYVMAIGHPELDHVPRLYLDFLSEEGLRALSRAMEAAFIMLRRDIGDSAFSAPDLTRIISAVEGPNIVPRDISNPVSPFEVRPDLPPVETDTPTSTSFTLREAARLEANPAHREAATLLGLKGDPREGDW